MSPGRPSRAAELGADPHHLSATIFHALEAASSVNLTSATAADASAACAATAQAAAIALLAVNVGRLVDAMEADIASIPRAATLPFPVPPGAPR